MVSPNSRVCRQRPVNGRLKILRAANGKQVQGQSLRPEFFFGSGMVNFDEREGIVMHAHDVFALEKVSGTDGIINIHVKFPPMHRTANLSLVVSLSTAFARGFWVINGSNSRCFPLISAAKLEWP